MEGGAGKEASVAERKVWARTYQMQMFFGAILQGGMSVYFHHSYFNEVFGFPISVFLGFVAALQLSAAIWRGVVPFAEFRGSDIKLRPMPLIGWCEVPYAEVEGYTVKGKKVIIHYRGEVFGEPMALAAKLPVSALGQGQRDTFMALLKQHLGPARAGD